MGSIKMRLLIIAMQIGFVVMGISFAMDGNLGVGYFVVIVNSFAAGFNTYGIVNDIQMGKVREKLNKNDNE